MTKQSRLPHPIHPLGRDARFNFRCHKGVVCFTKCCRMLELALTPYDVLRLRPATTLLSQELLDQYIIVEQEPGEPFPRFYLTMIDDGNASCVFVSNEGCSIYDNRPSACRTYPLGRAVKRKESGDIEEHFVLIKEQHCKGFAEPEEQTPTGYLEAQQLARYNYFNDQMVAILQHDALRKGLIPTKSQVDLFTLALYNIDVFRKKIVTGQLQVHCSDEELEILRKDDEELLRVAMRWITDQLFSPC